MPKMKTKSGAKKRFKLTASGKVKAGQAGKRHGMIKRTNDQIRKLRGTVVLSEDNAKVIRKQYMPYGKKKK
ncbi:MAG: 50S ribosomal protein L35 [Maricaulaceae bacterium]